MCVANAMTGASMTSAKLVAIPFASNVRCFQPRASTPAMIEPPDTDDTRVSFDSHPVSLRRRSEPRWKTIAR